VTLFRQSVKWGSVRTTEGLDVGHRHHEFGDRIQPITGGDLRLRHDPANWTKTYPHSTHVGGLPEKLPLKVGDTWTESGPDAEKIFTWHLAIAMRPKMWVFNSVGGLGHDPDGNGGM
jgi:hypothetical protein